MTPPVLQEKPYYIEYDDGDEEELNLAREDWLVASDDEKALPAKASHVRALIFRLALSSLTP